jgi:hypothetical protein
MIHVLGLQPLASFLSLGVMEGLIGSVDCLHVRHKASAQLEASYTFLGDVHARRFCRTSAYAHAHPIDAQLADIGGGV